MDQRKGLILGVYESANKPNVFEESQLTTAGRVFNAQTGAKLLDMLNKFSMLIKQGKCRILYGLEDKFDAVGVVGLGKAGDGVVNEERLHRGRENVRKAVAAGVVALRDIGVSDVFVDPCGYSDAAAEGATLSSFCFDELKSKEEDKKPPIQLHLYSQENDCVQVALWNQGSILAKSQNIVRRLSDMPANLLTPTKFAETAKRILANFSNVDMIVHDEAWARQRNMNAFLSVGKGSDEPSKFLEIHVKCGKATQNPVCLVGKGVCFDSGGISLKPSSKMASMRFDMTGGACVLGAIHAIAQLNKELPFNLIGLIPLVENLPSGKANKPGDVVIAMNGKSIEIENTDAEGRLILADALCYADTFGPSHVIDIATLTGAMMVALGSGATGVFTNCDELWRKMEEAGMHTGDRVWRMPLFQHYSDCVKLESVDLCNTSKPSFMGIGGCCTAAAFLKEFTQCKSWMHMDIAGVTENKSGEPLFNSNMTGRPVRTIIHCLENL